MQVTSSQFKKVASQKLADPRLQATLANAKGRFVVARTKAVSERPLVPKEKILDGALSTIP